MNKDTFQLTVTSIGGRIMAFNQKKVTGVLPDNAIEVTDKILNACQMYMVVTGYRRLSYGHGRAVLMYSENPEEIAELDAVHEKYKKVGVTDDEQ